MKRALSLVSMESIEVETAALPTAWCGDGLLESVQKTAALVRKRTAEIELADDLCELIDCAVKELVSGAQRRTQPEPDEH